jgi:hypothetical protein
MVPAKETKWLLAAGACLLGFGIKLAAMSVGGYVGHVVTKSALGLLSWLGGS